MIEFYDEHDISDLDNGRLMELLRMCFPMLPCFKTSRFWQERCDYRWLIRDADRIIANPAVHDKTFLADRRRIRIAGVAYVCVHPQWRRKGLVKRMLAEIHRWAKDRRYPFAFLFGRNEVYRSSGYLRCENELRVVNPLTNADEVKRTEKAHYSPLTSEPWPESLIDIQGPIF